MTGISAGLGIVLLTLQPPVEPAKAPSEMFSRTQLVAATSNISGETVIRGAVQRRKNPRRDMTIAGVVLMASGTAMMAVNSAGLASGTTIPPGGERDGYLGKPGVVIGGALVVTGIVLIVKAHRK